MIIRSPLAGSAPQSARYCATVFHHTVYHPPAVGGNGCQVSRDVALFILLGQHGPEEAYQFGEGLDVRQYPSSQGRPSLREGLWSLEGVMNIRSHVGQVATAQMHKYQ